MDETPYRTDSSVTIKRLNHKEYAVSESFGKTFHGGLLNIGGRAAAFPEGLEVELGGGESEVIIDVREDSRGCGDTLIAVGFSAEAIL